MRALLLSLTLVAALLSGCSDGGGADDGDGEDATSSASSSKTTTAGIAPQPDEVDLTVSAVGAYPVSPAFDPASLQVPAGALVHATFRNQEQVPNIAHNWVVDGIPGASSGNIGPGQEAKFDFTAPSQAGEFAYYCSIGDHRDRGMEGTLSVTVS